MKRKITHSLLLSPLPRNIGTLKGKISFKQHSRFFKVNTPFEGVGGEKQHNFCANT